MKSNIRLDALGRFAEIVWRDEVIAQGGREGLFAAN
jgi:hypothetical protein